MRSNRVLLLLLLSGLLWLCSDAAAMPQSQTNTRLARFQEDLDRLKVQVNFLQGEVAKLVQKLRRQKLKRQFRLAGPLPPL